MIIYKVTNLINNKIYIGQTKRRLSERKRNHRNSAAGKKHRNNHFYSAINKYGFDNFQWDIIDHAKDQEELNAKEKLWIARYKSNEREIGYNATEGGEGQIINEEVKIRHRAIMKQIASKPAWRINHKNNIIKRSINEEWIKNNKNALVKTHNDSEIQKRQKINLRTALNKKIICLETGKIFENGIAVSECFKITRQALSHHLKRKIIALNGLHFDYYDETQTYTDAVCASIISHIESKRKNVKILCLETGIIYDSAAHACNELQLDRGHMSLHLNNKIKGVKKLHFQKIFERNSLHEQAN